MQRKSWPRGKITFTSSNKIRRIQSYEAAVTGAMRDALEIDNLRNTIVTLKATSTERYTQFL